MNYFAKHNTNIKTIRLLVVLFVLFLASLYIKYRFAIKEKVIGETELAFDSQTAPKADTASPKISPIPQDPNKPKLTDDFLKKQVNSDIFKYIPVQTNGILSYIENETNKDQSGRIGKYNYLIETRKPTEEDNLLLPSTLTIKEGDKTLFRRTYEAHGSIGSYEIKTKNQITRIFKIFSYGAHCCVSLVPVTVINDKIYIGEPLDVGNTDTVSREHFFVQDDKLYKIIFDDRFSYYNMSFAQSSVMFYPVIYSVNENGFTPVPHLFKDYYEKLYQSSLRELAKIDTQLIDWEDGFKRDYIYGRIIYTYALGFHAGHDRQELKTELILKWPNLDIYETGIWEAFFKDTIPQYANQKVTYFAELKRFSTSGDMRFYWYDEVKKQRINPDDEDAWFFALPTNVPYDEKATDDWVKFIEKNKTATFKITGTREPDDCGYYGQDHCIQSVNIDKIEIVAK